MPNKTIFLAFIGLFLLLFPIKTYANSFASKKCLHYVKAIKNNGDKKFDISEAISWGNIAVKKYPDSMTAHECLADVYLKDGMLYNAETQNNELQILIHKRIQILKRKIIKEKRILLQKQNKSNLAKIYKKILNWLNYFYHLVVKNIDSITVISGLIILFIVFIIRKLKQIPKIFKWILEFCKKLIRNYRNKSIAKLFNNRLKEIAAKFLELYEKETDRCDTMISWIKEYAPELNLNIDFFYKNEINNWIDNVKKISNSNILDSFQDNAEKFSTIVYNYNYFFCKDLYDKLYDKLYDASTSEMTKEDWNNIKRPPVIDLISIFLPANADIEKLKMEWNRRIKIYNNFLVDWNNLVKEINKKAKERKIFINYIEINDNDFPQKLR